MKLFFKTAITQELQGLYYDKIFRIYLSGIKNILIFVIDSEIK